MIPGGLREISTVNPRPLLLRIEEVLALVDLKPSLGRRRRFCAVETLPHMDENSLDGFGPRGPKKDFVRAIVHEALNEKGRYLAMHALVQHRVFNPLKYSHGLLIVGSRACVLEPSVFQLL